MTDTGNRYIESKERIAMTAKADKLEATYRDGKDIDEGVKGEESDKLQRQQRRTSWDQTPSSQKTTLHNNGAVTSTTTTTSKYNHGGVTSWWHNKETV